MKQMFWINKVHRLKQAKLSAHCAMAEYAGRQSPMSVSSYRIYVRSSAFSISVLCLLAWVCLMLSACGGRSSAVASSEGDTLSLRHARLLCVVRHAQYTEVQIRHPWQQGLLAHYALVDSAHRQAELPPGMERVEVPLHRCVVSTAAHTYLMHALGRTAALAGVLDAQYMHQPWVHEGISSRRVTDCGSSMGQNAERIMAVKPDAVFVSPLEGVGHGRIARLGVPLIECADYMEATALGRAEWMKFYGMLWGCEQIADSLFDEVEKQYKLLQEKAAGVRTRPHVMAERKTGSVWYMPGGESTIAQLYCDAGARYAFASEKKSGSLALAPETVLSTMRHADVWLLSYTGQCTRRDLLSEYAGYAALRPFRTGRVYGCAVDTSMYFDEIPFRPDLLLRELIMVFHPGLLPGTARYYHLLR